MREALKLTTYSGERARHGGRPLADVLMDLYARRQVRTSALFRGLEGFGAAQRLRSARVLSLSEDLPLVTVAVDLRERLARVIEEVAAIAPRGLFTVERARLLEPNGGASEADLGGGAKLTVHLGRHERAHGRPAYLAAVELLHRHGVAGATVLLGVDGTLAGERRRGRFLASNALVPMMLLSVGDARAIARALPELSAMLSGAQLTLERVQVCKRDGLLLAEPSATPAGAHGGSAWWRKLDVYAGEQTRDGGEPLYNALVRRLRAEGAAGATVLRGIWGYHGEHRPHGEHPWSVRRRVPVLVTVIDTPVNSQRWFEIVDSLTMHAGLVTSELVPALAAREPPSSADSRHPEP
ncbi:MAG TPA: DUF190 domain-containing protein [Solirubrobacteraceae bacterium]|jgi:PII-like signaling protein|nr:DUF190 domain-containing protein [Solirubrobacteraceae bacterium]